MKMYMIQNRKFCKDCGSVMVTPQPHENILDKVIPELSNTMIISAVDEKKIMNFRADTLRNSSCIVARYNNPDGSNYFQIYENQPDDIRFFHAPDLKVGDIIMNIIKNDIRDPIVRGGFYFRANRNWWNTHLPDDTIINCRYAQEVLFINEGLKISKGQYEGRLEECTEDNLCALANRDSPRGEILLKEAISKIGEDLFYSSKMDKLYTRGELLTILDVEHKVIDQLIMTDDSQLIQIYDLSVHILSKKINALLKIAEIRREISCIADFKFNIVEDEILPTLLGLMRA